MPTGQLASIFTRILDGSLEQCIWGGSAWGSAVSVSATRSLRPAYIKESDTTARLVYSYGSSGGLKERIWANGTWGSELPVPDTSDYGAFYPSYTKLITGELILGYLDFYDYEYVDRVLLDSGWGSEERYSLNNMTEPVRFQTKDGAQSLIYIRDSDGYLVERTLQRYARIGAGIIAEGGNATTGYWEKWGNGKLVQWGTFVSTTATQAYNFPISFIAPPTYLNFHSPFVSTYIQSADLCASPPVSATSMTVITTKNGNSTAGLFFYWHAIGRWK